MADSHTSTDTKQVMYFHVGAVCHDVQGECITNMQMFSMF